jgi:hypothetical protein
MVITNLGDTLPGGAANEQRRKVDAGVDRQLQRAPEATVDLHDDGAACFLLSLALDHCDALPVERVEQPHSGTGQRLVERDAFPIDADTARRWLLPQAAMGEHGDRPTAPAQREESLADT